MTLRTRRIIYISFIIVFVIVAPVLILYTAGYRFNIKKAEIQKTGALVVNSEPEDVDVYVNNQLVATKTPARIHNLTPNEYLVKVEKDGYTSWQKKLEVKSKETTFAENVLLFKKSGPILKIEEQINLFSPSPNKIRIVYSIIKEENEEFWSWNLRTDEKILLSEFSLSNNKESNIIKITWFKNNEEILLSLNENEEIKHFVININKSEELILLKEITNLDLGNIRLDPEDDNLIYGRKDNIIYQTNLFTRNTKKLTKLPIEIEEQILDYIIKDKNVYYIKTNQEKTWLEKVEIEKADSAPVSNLPDWQKAKIKHDDSDLIIVLNNEEQEIVIINPDPEFPIYKEIKAKDIIWNQPYDKLLYYNDLEVWVYRIWDSDPYNEEIYTRYGQTINQADWYPKLGYITFSLSDRIKAVEPDQRDKRNIYELVEVEQIDNFILDPRGKKIYFTGTVQEKTGLYELEIQL